ncbi:galactose-1-phosphate uridylyltransferase [Thermodesulfobacteriota bacterium]
MSELRKDIITREWVILAKERAKRPDDFKPATKAVKKPANDPKCPFCEGNEGMTPPEALAYRAHDSKENGPGWNLRVINNKFAALKSEGELERHDVSIYDVMNGLGAHEVVIESTDHSKSIALYDEKSVQNVVWSYCDRYKALREDSRLKYISIFRNHGKVAGASLAHPHSQIVATPIIPQKVWQKVTGVAQYLEYREKCAYCDIIKNELAEKKRLISENGNFIAISPFASRSPFETWILPKKHKSCFAYMNRFEVNDFAAILKETMLRLHTCLEDPPYNYTMVTAPCETDKLDNFHWHLEVVPRLTTPAGFELGTSIYINVTPPEIAAKFLRDTKI